MDIPTALTDVIDVISAIDACQLNMNNLGLERYSWAYDYQTLLDATVGVNACVPVSCGAPPRPPVLDPPLTFLCKPTEAHVAKWHGQWGYTEYDIHP